MESIYTLQIFNQFPKVKQAISTKAFGSMKKDDGDINSANLLKFAKSQNFPNMPLVMRQVHGTNVALIENNRELEIPQTDGMVTNKIGIPLTILTADCLPILFYAPVANAIGVAHAGRKGLLSGIIAEIVSVMSSAYGVDPQELIVGIGPSIEKDCYEVDKTIIDEFSTNYPEFDAVYEEKDGGYYLDLRSVAQQALQKEGILERHIEVSDVCTKCDERFYSYRGGDKNGRFASVISLV